MPGVMIYVYFALAPAYVKIDHLGFTAALRASARAVHGNFWRILLVFLIRLVRVRARRVRVLRRYADRIAGDFDVRRFERHVSQRELVMAQVIPGVELDAQRRRDDAHASLFRIGELDALEHGAHAVEVPGEMHVVESHGEAGAIGDEFFEIGALLGNARRDDPREHDAHGAEQQQTKRDQHRASRPMRAV